VRSDTAAVFDELRNTDRKAYRDALKHADSIEQAVRSISDSASILWVARAMLMEDPQYVSATENCQFGHLVPTDQQLLFAGFQGSSRWPYSAFAGVTSPIRGHAGKAEAQLRLKVGETLHFSLFNRKSANKLIQVLDEMIKHAPEGTTSARPTSASVADELTKLVSLREAGILTSTEFDAQKDHLLHPTA
jgi:hypothetical protein